MVNNRTETLNSIGISTLETALLKYNLKISNLFHMNNYLTFDLVHTTHNLPYSMFDKNIKLTEKGTVKVIKQNGSFKSFFNNRIIRSNNLVISVIDVIL